MTPRRARAVRPRPRGRAGVGPAAPAAGLLGLLPWRAGPRVTETVAASDFAGRCAALLRGGVPATRVFSVLARETVGLGPRAPVRPGSESGSGSGSGSHEPYDPHRARRIAARMAHGHSAVAALAAEGSPPWRVLATAWQLGEESGAPLAPALERIGNGLRELERLGERREVLLSGPRSTVRLVAALPLATFGLGALLGFDPFRILLSTPGATLFTGGLALLGAGVWWARVLRQRVEVADRVEGIEYELVWIAAGGGAPPSEATRRVVDAVDALGARWIRLDRFHPAGSLASTIDTAAATGVALRPLLLEEAAGARARALTELEQAAERLAVRVLVPLGVCVLPAFIALGVAPVVLAMLGAG